MINAILGAKERLLVGGRQQRQRKENGRARMNALLAILASSFAYRGNQRTRLLGWHAWHRPIAVKIILCGFLILLNFTFFTCLLLAVFSAILVSLFFFFYQFFGTFRFWRGRRWQRKFGSTCLGNSDSGSIASNAFHVVKQAFVVVAWPEPTGHRRP